MKVKTLYTEEFNKECTALGHEIFAQFHPDVIIGVLTGGGFVGRQVAKVSPSKPIYTEIKIQRGGTSKKEKGLSSQPMFFSSSNGICIYRFCFFSSFNA